MKKTLVAVVLAMIITSLVYVIINKEAKEVDVINPGDDTTTENTDEVSNEIEKSTVILDLHEGYVATTISINSVSGVGGFIVPDTYVNIIVGKMDDDGEPITEVLYEEVRVLAVDTIYYTPETTEEEDTAAQPIVASTVTLEVEIDQVLKIFQYQIDSYEFRLVLIPYENTEETEEVEEVTNEDDNQSS